MLSWRRHHGSTITSLAWAPWATRGNPNVYLAMQRTSSSSSDVFFIHPPAAVHITSLGDPPRRTTPGQSRRGRALFHHHQLGLSHCETAEALGVYGTVGGRWRADCSMRDDSWRPIVEGLAVTAGSGMLDGDGLGSARWRRKVRPPCRARTP